MTAAATGDVEGLLAMLAPDATWTADGGGKATAAREPVVGAENVAAMVVGLFRTGQRLLPDLRLEAATCNGVPAMVAYSAGRLDGVLLVEIVDEKITNFYVIRNPDKLAGVAVPRTISR
jgi:RNA polymerase sigma-70 factor (ECF subfamily)